MVIVYMKRGGCTVRAIMRCSVSICRLTSFTPKVMSWGIHFNSRKIQWIKRKSMRRVALMKKLRPMLMVAIPAILLCLVVSHAVMAETGKPGEMGLSLRKVILFNSGVGYFELGGDVPAGEKIDLHFSVKQMNDVLKSLTVLNVSGGTISSIVYDSERTAEQQLNDYSFQLRKDEGLPQTLRQFQGNRIRLLKGKISITGTIVGVEKRIVVHDDMSTPEFYLTIMAEGGELQSVNTDEITGIRFLR